MKTQSLQSLVLTITAVTAVTLLAANAVAQESSTSTTAATTTPAAAQPAAASQAAPQLSYGVSQVVQLAHANIGEDVIVNYVQNSGNAYGLDANQILYLKQQGISYRIINAMLNQRGRLVAAQTAPQPNNSGAYSSQIPTTTPPPPVSYVQTAPPQTVYVVPDTQTYDYYAYSYPYYYPYYGWPVTFSFGWGGYYGGGYRGGYWGGYHGGGGWHSGGGGWHSSGGGGGWHSSGGWHR
jgi:uncharacterized membrane protein YgcG